HARACRGGDVAGPRPPRRRAVHHPPVTWGTGSHLTPRPTSKASGTTWPNGFSLLASYPQLGRRRDNDLRPGLRSFPVGEYVIIYRIEVQDDVLILRVLRGSRNLQALFRH